MVNPSMLLTGASVGMWTWGRVHTKFWQQLSPHLNEAGPGGQIMPTLYWCPHQVLKATGAPVEYHFCLATSVLVYISETRIRTYNHVNRSFTIRPWILCIIRRLKSNIINPKTWLFFSQIGSEAAIQKWRLKIGAFYSRILIWKL